MVNQKYSGTYKEASDEIIRRGKVLLDEQKTDRVPGDANTQECGGGGQVRQGQDVKL